MRGTHVDATRLIASLSSSLADINRRTSDDTTCACHMRRHVRFNRSLWALLNVNERWQLTK